MADDRDHEATTPDVGYEAPEVEDVTPVTAVLGGSDGISSTY